MKAQLYWVDWIHDGFCYRSTHSVTREQIKEMRKIARALGDKLEISKM